MKHFITWAVLTIIAFGIVAFVTITQIEEIADNAVDNVAIHFIQDATDDAEIDLTNDAYLTKIHRDLHSEIIKITILPLIILLIITVALVKFYLMKKVEDKMYWFQSILEAFTENPISVTDMNKNLVYLNKTALAVLGKTEEEVLGKNCGTVWGVDICKDERCGIEYLKCGKGKSVFNVGDAVFTTSASYIKDKDGNNVGHIEVVTNITKEVELHKRIEDRVHFYETVLNAFVESPISVVDVNKNITFLNKAALNILGKTEEEVLGKNCGTVWGVDICKDERCGIEYLKCGKGKSVFNVGDVVFTTSASYLNDAEGKHIGYVEVVSNISADHHKKEYNNREVAKLAENITKLAVGDIDVDFTVSPPNEYTKEEYENYNSIQDHLHEVRNAIAHIMNDTKEIAEALHNGNISLRMDATKHKGNFRAIIESINYGLSELYKPLAESAKVLQEMSAGDLTVRITSDYQNDMNDLKNYINHLGDSLTRLISQLTEAIHTTAAASAEISSTADTLSAAIHEQSSQTDEVASAMEEMSRTVVDNAHSASKTAEVAKQSGEVANNGSTVVKQTVNKMREIAAVVKTSAENIAKLGESSKKIGEIIGVIDDIADQTNLLSLNAAIEAARAGEQGRGFAVVADSVGKLAISTASATKEIADMIKGIQRDTESAVKAMEKGTVEVQSGIEFADNAGRSLEDILAGINELLDMVNQIAAASNQQSATSEMISKNVSSISKVSADSARNVEDVASTANELARMTETLTNLVSRFKVSGGGKSSLDLK